MKEKSKSYLIKFILIIFAVYITLFGINNYFKSKSLNRPLPEVKLKEKIEKEKTFAIMISEDGSNYQKYESNEWPNENYKFKEAKCIDNNGNLIDNAVSFESATKTVILETDKTVVCTIYFDKSTLGKLRENEKLLNKDNLSSDLQGGMYRYQGTDNVANWICFGTEDNCGTNDELVDKYMYRIIGITPNDELYLIKETFIKEDETNIFMWNNKDSVDPDIVNYCTNGICPEWPQSILYKRLNGTSNGTQTGNVQTLDKEWTDIFVDSSEYNYLKSGDKINGSDSVSEWYNLIDEHEWLYGDTIDYSIAVEFSGNSMYEIEHGEKETSHYVGIIGNIKEEQYVWTQKATGKINLMYLSDYFYSYYDGSTEESRGNARSYSVLKNSWIHFQKDGYNTNSNYEWLNLRWGIYSVNSFGVLAFGICSDGDWSRDSLIVLRGLRPVFYLSPKAKISDGNGTKTNPFRIEM